MIQVSNGTRAANGRKRDGAVVAGDDARVIGAFLLYQIAEHAAAPALEVGARAGELVLEMLRHQRHRQELRVRMVERRAGLRAEVLDDQKALEAEVAPQVAHALAPRPQHPLHLLARHRRQGRAMVGRFDDHLVRAKTAEPLKERLPGIAEVRFDPQRRLAIGDDADLPAGAVVGRAGRSPGENFAAGERLLTLAERTQIAVHGADRRRPAKGVARQPPFGRDDHVAAGDRVSSQFRHRENSIFA